MNDLNQIFQDYIAENIDKGPIDFSILIENHPDLKDALKKKIKAYQKVIGTFNNDETEPSSSSLIGREVNGCKLIKVIGQGGMGVVYLGYQEKLKRDVVVKVLRPFAVDNKTLKERFIRESRTIGRLNHSNIVPVYDVGEEKGSFFIIMKYVEGVPLNKLIENISKLNRFSLKISDIVQTISPLKISNNDLLKFKSPTDFFCNLIIKVADAVEYAHQNGIIHRDIKPSNIIIEPNGNPILLDFGLSHDEVEQNLTLSGEFLGTPVYSAPELFLKNSANNNKQLDIYSLGVTLYELLTGGLPYEGSSIYEIYSNIKSKEPIRPKLYWNGIPRDLETIISTSISKDIGFRYGNIAIFRDDLENFLSYKPIKAKSPSSIQRILYFTKRKKSNIVLSIAGLILSVSLIFLATDWLNRAKKLAKERASALMNEAQISEVNNSYDDAVKKIQQAYTLDPKNIDFLDYLLQIRMRAEKDFNLGLMETEEYLKKDPNNITFLDWKAYFLDKLNKHEDSLNLEKSIIAMEPTNLNHYFHIIPKLQAMNKYEEVLLISEKGLDINPNNFDLYGSAAAACDKMKNVICADKYYKLILTNISSLPNSLIKATPVYEAIPFFESQGKYLEAKQFAEKYLEIIPEDQIIRSKLAHIYEQIGSDSNALDELKTIVKTHPNDGFAWANMGRLLNDKYQQYNEALRAFETALKLNYKEPFLILGLADTYTKSGRYKDSQVLLNEFINSKNNNPKIDTLTLSRAYALLGISFFKESNYSKSILQFNNAIKLEPNDWRFYVSLGDVYKEAKQFKKAESTYIQAIKIGEDNYETRIALLNFYKAANELTNYEKYYNAERKKGGLQYLNNDIGIKFTSPFGWFCKPGDFESKSGKVLVNCSLPASKDPVERLFGITIGLFVMPNVKNFNDVIHQELSILKDIYGGGDILNQKIYNQTERPLPSYQTERLIQFHKFNLKVKERVIIKNNVAFILYASALSSRFDYYNSDFEISLSSLTSF